PPPPPPAPPPGPRAAGAAADGRELLLGLAGDRRVVGASQTDPAALAVDLDHRDIEFAALAEDVLGGRGPLARLDRRDVEEAVGALDQLDEGAERGRLDDLALELIADLGL